MSLIYINLRFEYDSADVMRETLRPTDSKAEARFVGSQCRTCLFMEAPWMGYRIDWIFRRRADDEPRNLL